MTEHDDIGGAPEDDAFELYDLRVEVIGCRPGMQMVCNHPPGAYFEVSGENLSLPPGGAFSIYALAALLPLLPAKQRPSHPNDWMTTDAEVACPDPNCGGLFRITRMGKRTFRHRDVTAVPLHAAPDAAQQDVAPALPTAPAGGAPVPSQRETCSAETQGGNAR